MAQTSTSSDGAERILLMSLGSRGDMEPFLALAEELRRERSTELRLAFCFPEQFRSLASEVSSEFYGLDRAFLELMESDDVKKIIAQVGSFLSRARAFWRLFWDTKPLQQQLIRDQRQAVEAFRPDLIIFHIKCVYPILAALQLGQRVKLLCPVPCMLHPVDSEPSVGFGSPGSVWWNRLTYTLANKMMIEKAILGFGAPLCREFGFQSLDRQQLEHWIFHVLPTEYAISEELFPRPSEWPEHVVMSNFRERDKTKHWAPPAEVVAFFEKHPAPLYVGFGSMINDRPKEIGQILLAVTAEMQLPVLLNAGWGGIEVEDCPAHALLVRDIPFDWLFPRVRAVVHHGGSGTTHSALRCGRKQLIIPHLADQFMWMRLVAKANQGPMGVAIKDFTKESFQKALTDLLNPAVPR
ncbi:Sterol 3-beta-glucosyltransferase UGT80B1 (Protein TRANSPARENT TESTA 15) (UDP-glucose:sterol glucosyltransferase 80B1) [Durusdinium trenchii]|uniref:Sterol 3-beta-glucosyltransferase UGT80B1 (Protein TRANSPARENT TESTA 15) (UDP-glucose:sterol glucosyltransferase 80B1) n=1 Tax=Durusdinium trenchii TaxID=1381693 RepID=A0ABP0LX92_9DINO